MPSSHLADPPRLALPPAPAPSERPGFPLLATLTPVVGSVVLFAVTGSPFALVFAALGPIVAVAGVLDGRRGAKRRERRARRERAALLEELRRDVDAAHARERVEARRIAPSARAVLDGEAGPGWDRDGVGDVVLGTGGVPSALRIDGTPADDADRELLAAAHRLEAAPVRLDAEAGIGFVGPPALVAGAARAVLVQCLHAVRPERLAIEAPAGAWGWAATTGRGATVRIDERSTGAAPLAGAPAGPGAAAPVVIATAADAQLLPPGLGAIVRIDGPDAAEFLRPIGRPGFAPSFVGLAEATAFAEGVAERARAAGLGAAAALPERLGLAELPAAGGSASRNRLAVHVGLSAGGPVELDLAGSGPHALVAGTTGSGKSEFLVTWLAALAEAHPPERLSLLLVDFKGGAAFEPLRGLPHVAGIVTDLDETEARRALESLRAEFARRERVLAAAGVGDIARLGDEHGHELARLVLVVDEFQALIERFPELGAVIADIAQRGRSLGVHLVLAAQRPMGVVRDAVSANCSIRVCLRVLGRADSLAVVGVDDAAGLDPAVPGRGIVDPGTGRTEPVQFALTTGDDLARIAARHDGARPARRPWLDALPTRLAAARLADGGPELEDDDDGIPFGLLDVPERQARRVARWAPARHGALLVAGRPGSGRTTALAAIAAAHRAGGGAVLRIGGPGSAVWDGLRLARERADAGSLVVIDDLDRLGADWDPDHRLAAVELIAELVRGARARGVAVAASAVRLSGPLHALADGFGASVLLAHAQRGDLVQAGGDPALWRPSAPPGSGQWLGRALQLVGDAAPLPEPVALPVPVFAPVPGALHLVAAGSPGAVLERWRAACPDAPAEPLRHGEPGAATLAALRAAAGAGRAIALVGDADAWAAQWALLAAERDGAVVVVDGGPAEHRALVRDRALPPLLDPGAGQLHVQAPGGQLVRARWATTDSEAPTSEGR